MAEARTLCILIALVLLAGALPGAESPDILDEKITLELADARARDVFSSFASILGGKVELDPAVSGKVTLQLRQVSARTVLTAMCEMLACRWNVTPGRDDEGPTLTIRPLAPAEEEAQEAGTLASPVTLSLDKAPQQQVFSSFAEILGAELQLSWETTVTLELSDATVDQALDEACAQAGCSWRLSEDDGRRVLEIWK